MPLILSFREGNNPGDTSKITYGDLLKRVCKFSNVLRNIGELSHNFIVIICQLFLIYSLIFILVSCMVVYVNNNAH